MCEVKGTLSRLADITSYKNQDGMPLMPPFVFSHPASIVSHDDANPTIVDARVSGQDSRLVRSYCGGDRVFFLFSLSSL